MEEHGNNVSGIVSTELTALRHNADKTAVQPALITYTEPRLAALSRCYLIYSVAMKRLPRMALVSRVCSSAHRLPWAVRRG